MKRTLIFAFLFLNYTAFTQYADFWAFDKSPVFKGFRIDQKLDSIPQGYESFNEIWIRNTNIERTEFFGVPVSEIYVRLKAGRVKTLKLYFTQSEVRDYAEIRTKLMIALGEPNYPDYGPGTGGCSSSSTDWVGHNVYVTLFTTDQYAELTSCRLVLCITRSTRFFRKEAGVK